MADGVDDAERTAAESLIACARWYPDVFSALLQKPWVGDDITASETTAILRLRWTAKYSPEIGQDILRKPWIQDDVTSAEATLIEYLYWSGRNIPELAGEILGESWVLDEISSDEATVIQNLYWIARPEDETFQQQVVEAAIGILDMPFLESVESADALAMKSLQRLENNNTTDFLGIMSHPTISDGISDEEAKIVVLLGGTYTYRPESVDFLLRGTGVYLEERVIELPHSGEVLLTIIRIRDQITPSMDFLEHSVRTIDEFMGEPLPTNYIAYFFDDAVLADAGGQHFGTHITSKLIYDVENGHSWKHTPSHIAHEVGHYYFTGSNRRWIDEGAADLLSSVSEYARIGTPVDVTSNPCASAKTISEIERLAYGGESIEDWKAYRCNYPLGERLFVDLYDSLGEETFRQGFRNLYLKSLRDDATDDCEGTDLGICHLVAAFKADVSAEVAAQVDEIVGRWYGETP